MEKPRIILIDGSGYIFRAFYAISRLSTSKGMPTNAVYGFINMLLRVLEVEKPEYLAIAFDTAKPTFRKERYSDYKANREAPPDDLIIQIPYIYRAVDAFGIVSLIKEGFEADDLLGTVARRAEAEGFRVDIITGDKDLMQLVNENINLFDTMKDRRVDPSAVKERLGVRPDQVIDFLALMGDSSDNIPGVTGIGEKSAAELLCTFDSLDGVYRRLGEIKSEKRRDILVKEKEVAYLSQELATIKCDVPYAYSLPSLKYNGPVLDALKSLFEELEFQNLLKRFDLVQATPPNTVHYETVLDAERLRSIVTEIERRGRVCVDTETTSLKTREALLVGISLAVEPLKAVYIPVGHYELANPARLLGGQLDAAMVRETLRGPFENPKIQKIGQNLKYDIQILRNWGINLQGVESDTLVGSYLLDPERPHNLDALAQRYLQHQTIKYEDVTGKGKAQISFAEVALEPATRYSAEDADVTLRVNEKVEAELKSTTSLDRLYRTVEVPLVQVLARMEFDGVRVDRDRLDQMSAELTVDLDGLEKSIFTAAGESFNINSPKQLGDILFKKLGLPTGKKTKTGYSTDESVLRKLSGTHPIAKLLIQYREWGKLKSTFVDGLLSEISSVTGRIHTHYNQTVTATGRLSSSNPNLQNIPASADPKYDIRTVFVSQSGYRLLSADYSQIELRLLAHLSRDSELMDAFKRDEDVHERTAMLIFGGSQVSSEQRKIAKTINFGVMYGQTPFGLSQTLGISLNDAKRFIDRYFERYSGVKKYLEQLVETARRQGFAETVSGRRRFIPELNSRNRMRREMAERAAINAPVQGTAADLIKMAMLRVERKFIDDKIDGKMLLQVHDELVFEVSEKMESQAEIIVRDSMENAMSLDVKLKVDMGWGRHWRECG